MCFILFYIYNGTKYLDSNIFYYYYYVLSVIWSLHSISSAGQIKYGV